MILSVSRRTDIPAHYADWFFRRLKEYQPTILFVEHDKAFCENVATKVVEL